MNKQEFKYDESNPCETGLFYYLGTNGLTTAYRNPCDSNIAIASSSPIKKACHCSASTFIGLGHGVAYCITQNKTNSQFTVDLKDKYVIPTGYALRNYSNGDGWWITGWNLEATNNNGKTWIIIDKQRNSNDLKGKGKICYFPIKQNDKYFTQFRIVLQQECCEGGWELSMSGFELYGVCVCIDIDSINDIDYKDDEKQQYKKVTGVTGVKANNLKLDSMMQKIEQISSKIDKIQQKMNDVELRINEEQKDAGKDVKFDKIMKEITKIHQHINKLSVDNIDPEQEKVKLWLENKVKLSEYYAIFVENGIVDLATVSLLTMDSIKRIGIDKVGHQMKILNEIIKLKQNNDNEGGPTAYQ